MKKQNNFFLILFTISIAISCSEENVSDVFEEVNGDVAIKLMESISVSDTEDSSDNTTVTMYYTNDGKLNTISDGNQTNVFVYDNDNKLTRITSDGDNLNMEELYESPYDAFDTGEVVEYDDNNNPKKIEFLVEECIEDDYDYCYDEYEIKIYTAELSYDDAHNPFYHTFNAGGIIDVLDNVELNFGSSQSPEIVKVKDLFPMNNLSQIIYKNEEGEQLVSLNINFSYDDENYPTSATITAVDIEESEQSVYSVIFTYID
jgi:hypothetical protein